MTVNWKKFIPKLSLNQILSGLTVLGIISAIGMVIVDQKPIPVSDPITPPSIAPYQHFIAGVGIVEAPTGNISVGTQISGVIDKVCVKVGKSVLKGEPLFFLDSRQLDAVLRVQEAQLETAQKSLLQAQVNRKDAKDKLDLVTQLPDKRAITKEELITRRNNVLIADANVGAAKSAVDLAKTQVQAARVNQSLCTVRAPIDGEILQVNCHVGEYANAGVLSSPNMLIGQKKRYNVRVNIDENDAWRFSSTKRAIGFLRGNSQFSMPLKLEYIEPYVVPKLSLTGDAIEQIDTRVFQAVYSYDPKSVPSYIGQQVDVYIEADPYPKDGKYTGPMKISR